jgi:hypothetical protein
MDTADSETCVSASGTSTTQSTKDGLPAWIEETISTTTNDTRAQPWRSALGDNAGNRFDDEKDLVKVEKSVGGKFDPTSPFRTQNSSLSA